MRAWPISRVFGAKPYKHPRSGGWNYGNVFCNGIELELGDFLVWY